MSFNNIRLSLFGGLGGGVILQSEVELTLMDKIMGLEYTSLMGLTFFNYICYFFFFIL